jgi:hypothetical protein
MKNCEPRRPLLGFFVFGDLDVGAAYSVVDTRDSLYIVPIVPFHIPLGEPL